MNNLLSKYKIGGVVLGLALSIGLTSCDDMFEPAIENHLGFEYMYDHPDYADGVLGNAYTRLPNGSYSLTSMFSKRRFSQRNLPKLPRKLKCRSR